MIHGVVSTIVAGKVLDLPDHIRVASTSLSRRRALLLQVFEQLAELAEVARLGGPVGDQWALLVEFGDHSVDQGASLADPLVFDQSGPLVLCEVGPVLEGLDQADTWGTAHVKG